MLITADAASIASLPTDLVGRIRKDVDLQQPLVKGNTATGNWYTPATANACGLLIYQANRVKQSANALSANQTNLRNAGRGGGHFNP